MQKKRILIVDDEPAFTMMVRKNLERTGFYEVQELNSPRQVLNVARQFLPDLILLDVIMPELDGGQLAAKLQEDPILKNVRIIFVTAILRRGEEGTHGGLFFLAKPVGIEDLVKCIEENLKEVALHSGGD